MKEFKWLQCTDKDGKAGLKCKVCSLYMYGKTPQDGQGSWCTTPGFVLRRDRIAHEKFSMHKAAIAGKADTVAGGINKSFSDQKLS